MIIAVVKLIWLCSNRVAIMQPAVIITAINNPIKCLMIHLIADVMFDNIPIVYKYVLLFDKFMFFLFPFLLVVIFYKADEMIDFPLT